MNDPGYWLRENIFSKDECDSIVEFLQGNEVLRCRAGARKLMSIPRIRRLANEERLLNLTAEIAGKTLLPYKATLFEKTGKANWLVAFHQDTALPLENDVLPEGWGQMSVKNGVIFAHAPTAVLCKILAIRIHLDPSTPLNGPLRVIPDSHHQQYQRDLDFDRYMEGKSEVECLVGKGGVIVMSPLLIHASSKAVADQPRRVLHIEYTETFDLGDGVRLAMS